MFDLRTVIRVLDLYLKEAKRAATVHYISNGRSWSTGTRGTAVWSLWIWLFGAQTSSVMRNEKTKALRCLLKPNSAFQKPKGSLFNHQCKIRPLKSDNNQQDYKNGSSDGFMYWWHAYCYFWEVLKKQINKNSTGTSTMCKYLPSAESTREVT
jgi:hypothetical protein